MLNFIKFLPARAELFHADGPTDTHVTKLLVAFRNFAIALNISFTCNNVRLASCRCVYVSLAIFASVCVCVCFFYEDWNQLTDTDEIWCRHKPLKATTNS